MLKAIFKPDDSNVLVLRDGDTNEIALVKIFLDKLRAGHSVEIKERIGITGDLCGMILKLSDEPINPDDPDIPVEPAYIDIVTDVVNDFSNLPLFKLSIISVLPEYVGLKIDLKVWALLKEELIDLGLDTPSITSDGVIIAENITGDVIVGNVIIPEGLINYVGPEEMTNYYNAELEIELGG